MKPVVSLLLPFLLAATTAKKAHYGWDKKEWTPKASVEKQLEEEKDIFAILEEDEKYEEEKQKQKEKKEKEWEFGDIEESEESEESVSACVLHHCGAGRECVEVEGEATCPCVEECGTEWDSRRRVCSNHNTTFPSECSLYRARCHCEEGGERCSQPLLRHAHIEYYGECRHIPECHQEELADFPRRMRDWMFNVMKELAERKEISAHYQKLEKEAEEDAGRRWGIAAVWQWCTLDHHPHDAAVSRHELFPLRAPLHSLEHCLSPFLDSCDSDDDHSLTLGEWAACLELKQEDLEERCEEVRPEEEA